MKDNTAAILVIGLLGFLAIIITGKWLLDRRDNDHRHRPIIVQQQPAPMPPQPQPKIESPPVIVLPPQQPVVVLPPTYPHHAPTCHGNKDFWLGYRDGYRGLPVVDYCPEYSQGYRIGHYDRLQGRPYYYDRYWREPGSGFSLRIPGFSLNIR